MFIQTEETPNPQTIKLIPGEDVARSGVLDFTSKEEASISPLATQLFLIDGVIGVFLGKDFITVTKSHDSEWNIIKPLALAEVMDFYNSGQPIIKETMSSTEDDIIFSDEEIEPEIIDQIKELLETRVRPSVAQDGGDIVYKGFKNGIVYLHMRGACAGCPSSTMTLKVGIENLLKHYIPEVQAVESIT